MRIESDKAHPPIAAWHRNLLATAAVFTVLLIGMGGILCVTQSIRSCPDWPGCFGKILPPPETSSILEMAHRLLAGISGLLILSAAIAGWFRTRRLRWIAIPPLVACLLVIEVSYFGAQAVLRGLSPGWAAVDLGSALLVLALIVAAAVTAHTLFAHPHRPVRPSFRSPFARLVLVTTTLVYAVLVSGVLVAGSGSVTACVGWPIYSTSLFQGDLPGAGKILRLVASVAGVGLILATLALSWRSRRQQPAVFRLARWVGAAFLLEALVQALLLGFGLQTGLLVAYTVIAAASWGLLVALTVRVGLA